ncbi:hypothetical protein OAF54_02830 [bacterium]|nr:hypothetical protein [bacterium]
MPATITVEKLRHPHHYLMWSEWEKYRLAFEGGRFFKERYLKQFSVRETTEDFNKRRIMTHVPAHAKAAITDIRNAIFKSMTDITRRNGPDSYMQAISGLNHGVDGRGSTMNGYLGREILKELLVIGRVGIYIDKPAVSTLGLSLAEARSVAPYLYYYQAEDIYSWHYDDHNMLDTVLLRDHEFTVDETTGLINGERERFRLLKKVFVDNRFQVEVTLYGDTQQNLQVQVAEPILVDIPEIPFVLLELDNSLMADIADYQITMLNLASSDVNYALKANFPFYIEQFHPASELANLRPPEIGSDGSADDGSRAHQVNTGVAQGRRYPVGLEAPGFIHPSSEPLKASMDLQSRMRSEIRQLVNLSLSSIQPVRASAESKDRDNQGLEGGLQNIGLELEHAERNIGRIWWLYESSKPEEVTVRYPSSYNLRTDADRRQEAKELRDLLPAIPSLAFQKQTAKDITLIMQGHKVSMSELKEMFDEIDSSPVVVTDPDIIKQDHEAGFVGNSMASQLRGYPEGEAEVAAKDHAERAARIVTAQIGAKARADARGARDLGNDPGAGREERAEANDTTLQQTSADRTRGEGQ